MKINLPNIIRTSSTNFPLDFSKAICTSTRMWKEPKQAMEGDKKAWQTVICSNGMIACWHPAKGIPYEHSRPVDLAELDRGKEKFLQRVNKPENAAKKLPYGESGPDDLSLREIFYTNMQEWRPRTREKRLYKSAAPVEQKKVTSNPIEPIRAPVIQEYQRLVGGEQADKDETGMNENSEKLEDGKAK